MTEYFLTNDKLTKVHILAEYISRDKSLKNF